MLTYADVCAGEELMEWWMLSDEEAAYMHSAFPAGQTSIDHILLQAMPLASVYFLYEYKSTNTEEPHTVAVPRVQVSELPGDGAVSDHEP